MKNIKIQKDAEKLLSSEITTMQMKKIQGGINVSGCDKKLDILDLGDLGLTGCGNNGCNKNENCQSAT